MRLLNKSLLMLILIIHPAYGTVDGRWQLTINGVDQLEFGTQQLAGGLKISWRSILEFSIKQGQFEQGTVMARLMPQISAFSRPENIFDCSQVIGTFASRSGASFSTPHLRYQSFPLSGKVVAGKVLLVPYLEYPGNYYAVLYQCSTENELGQFWLERAPRISRELGRRQNSSIDTDAKTFKASIKEVKSIPPGPELEIPLQDGFTMRVQQDFGARQLKYELKRIASD